MKYFLLFILFSGMMLQGQNPAVSEDQEAAISLDNLEETISYLASDELKGRDMGSPGIEKAATYIENRLKKAGLQPYFKTYRDSFEHKDLIGYNIVAFKEGTDPQLKEEIIVIGAHYDHIGIIQAVEGDSIANGANDNASGTAAVLELADYFSQRDTKRSVLFTLFSGEERGLLGSSHLAQRLKSGSLPISAMLNFEMVGVPMKDKDYLAYLTGYEVSNMAEVMNSYAGKKTLGFLPQARQLQLFRRSDNYAFYEHLKTPAHTISTFDFTNFDHYHQVGDEVALMDIPSIEKLLTALLTPIEEILNSDEFPIKLN